MCGALPENASAVSSEALTSDYEQKLPASSINTDTPISLNFV